VDGEDGQNLACLADGRRETDQAELEQCPGCLAWVPLDQFCELVADLDLNAPLPHCASCRTNGVPQPKFLNLTNRHRQAIDLILAAPSLQDGYRAASEATGFSRQYLYQLATGRRVPEFRRFFQIKLEAAGADMDKVIAVKVGALDAEEQKWNPKEEQFNSFPDWRTRLRASQDCTKLLEMEPPKAEGASVGIAIKIETNLGTGETHDPPNVMRPKPAVVDVGRPQSVVVDVSHAQD
jgi:hypothetical protein